MSFPPYILGPTPCPTTGVHVHLYGVDHGSRFTVDSPGGTFVEPEVLMILLFLYFSVLVGLVSRVGRPRVGPGD